MAAPCCPDHICYLILYRSFPHVPVTPPSPSSPSNPKSLGHRPGRIQQNQATRLPTAALFPHRCREGRDVNGFASQPTHKPWHFGTTPHGCMGCLRTDRLPPACSIPLRIHKQTRKLPSNPHDGIHSSRDPDPDPDRSSARSRRESVAGGLGGSVLQTRRLEFLSRILQRPVA
ncbi:hypothetical protein N658DRAFT_93004 [Parathielavia hyrcaniae]|uniref:Uncharacterized protein n=1 Tax=Parathielavia hyrcaniae TaxID=113614 RepID=A0AAN6T1D4_9PEZI|nr:hypothetical protein N658DRAFT_93004 [Parathielavia hyrcaniae]